MKKWIRFLFDRYFVVKPHLGLRVLYLIKLDILLYTVPVFFISNIKSFKKLIRLKLKGSKPKIVYFSTESDGRFNRFYELSHAENDLVVFRFIIQLMNVEEYYFASYAARPIGFYEDARYLYIKESNLKNRIEYRKFVHKVLNALEFLTGKIDLFLSGSNNDRYVVEMIYVAQERGTSWVVQEREGTGTDLTYKMEGIGFKESNSVVAHYHFLANDKHRDCFENAKTSSVRFTKTLGELDTDFWFNIDQNLIREKYKQWDHFERVVLFLTFGVRNYIEPTSFPNHPNLSWKPLIDDCEEVLLKFAKENPKTLVIYRMGHKEDLNAKFLNQVETLGLKNVIPSDRMTPYIEVALRSDLIIGFQSTAMFEAMFTDKPIIQVNWHIPDILNVETDLLPISKYGACKVANSKDELSKLINLWNNNDPSMMVNDTDLQNRKKTREIMFHQADGHVAERFLVEIKSLLKER